MEEARADEHVHAPVTALHAKRNGVTNCGRVDYFDCVPGNMAGTQKCTSRRLRYLDQLGASVAQR